MALLLDLNDLGIRCYADGELLHESPGVALVESDRLRFGEAALQASRSQPLHTHSRFWSQLDVTPLNSAHHQVRHHADLAYLHLRHIESCAGISLVGQTATLVVSGQLDRQAMGLLLGIVKQTGLQVTGLVDSALASLLPQLQQTRVRHLEIHLHHTILTELRWREGTLQLHNLEVLPDLGWLDLQTHLLKFLSTEFIRQARFNPRHDASSEQQLFDAVPAYLRQLESERVIDCQLPSSSIKLDARDLSGAVQAWLKPLGEALTDDGTELYLGDRLARLGMFLPFARGAHSLSAAQVGSALQETARKLSHSDASLRFTSALPCPLGTAPDPLASAPATHILHASRAYPLAGCWSLLNDGDAPLHAGQQQRALALLRNNRIQPLAAGAILLNGQPLLEERPLQRGDRLRLGSGGPTLDLISVED